MTRTRAVVALAVLFVLPLTWRGDATATGASYTYDELGRLTAVLNQDNTGETYSYDKAGNRTKAFSGNPSIFSITGLTVSEGGVANLTVTRSGAATTTATVKYKTVAGTAAADVNYTPTPTPVPQLSFAAGVTSQPITITTLDDGKYDVPQDFIVRLENQSANAALGTGVSDATVTVTNTDPAPSFAISASAAVNEAGNIVFTVTKTNATAATHLVSYATSSGTADETSDFTDVSGTLTFLPSHVNKTFTVTTLGDTLYESAETFPGNLSTPTNGAVLGTASANGTINNTTVAPSFSVNNQSVTEGQNAIFTITRTGGSSLSHAINYVTVNGTAIAATNYTSASGAKTFTASSGNATQTVTVPTQNDGTATSTLNFAFNLSAPTNGATVGTGSGTGSIAEDNAPPGIPASITPAYQYVTGGTFTISWTASPTGLPTAYELWTSINDGGAFTNQSSQYSGTGLSWTRPGSVTHSNEHFYRVRACNAYGCSGYRELAHVLVCIGGVCQ